jgi:hypothetical protein
MRDEIFKLMNHGSIAKNVLILVAVNQDKE